MNPAKIIKAYHSGENISNRDLLEAIPFFEDLASKLHKCGPVMLLAAREATTVARECKEYARARGLLK